MRFFLQIFLLLAMLTSLGAAPGAAEAAHPCPMTATTMSHVHGPDMQMVAQQEPDEGHCKNSVKSCWDRCTGNLLSSGLAQRADLAVPARVRSETPYNSASFAGLAAIPPFEPPIPSFS